MDKITIDLKKLEESGLTLLEYLVLVKAYYFSILKIELPLKFSDDIANSLQERNLIKIGNNKLYIREEGLKLFEDNRDNLFQKFYDTFPKYVPNGRGGQRVLAPKSMDSVIAQEAYKKWKTLTRNDNGLKELIIKCLLFEIYERKKNGELAYMHNIVTWINKRYWQMYEERILQQNDNTNTNQESKEKSI